MQRESKLKKVCSSQELVDLLRSLADALDRGAVVEGMEETAWIPLDKLHLSVKSVKPEAMEVKLKVVSRGSAADQAPDSIDPAQAEAGTGSARPRGRYAALKKRMRKSFKNIIYALHDRVWPDIQDVETFARDSALMVRYPGKGDAFYAEYAQAAADFHAAVTEQNMDAAIEKVHLLNDLKTRCHKLYD